MVEREPAPIEAVTDPNPFAFAPVWNATPGTVYTAMAPILGITLPVQAWCDDGEIGVGYTSDLPTQWDSFAIVLPNQNLFVRRAASPSPAGYANATVAIGAVQGTFAIQTLTSPWVPFADADDPAFTLPLPDQADHGVEPIADNIWWRWVDFTFGYPQTGLDLEVPAYDYATINVDGAVTISGGALGIADTWGSVPNTWATTLTVTDGQLLAARVVTASTETTWANATATLTNAVTGAATASLAARTLAVSTPAPFDFIDVGAAQRGLVYTAGTRITGFLEPITVATSAGEIAVADTNLVPTDPAAWSTGPLPLRPNQFVFVRLTASADFGTAVAAVVTAGGVSGRFQVTTEATDTLPNLFAFTPLDDQERGRLVVSNAVQITGFNLPVEVTTSLGEIAVANTTLAPATGWTTSATIRADQFLFARVTTSPDFATAVTATIQVGDGTGRFTATTRAAVIPNGFVSGFDFGTLTDQDLNTLVVSLPVRISGIGRAIAKVATSLGEMAVSLTPDAPTLGWAANTAVLDGQYLFARMNTSANFATALVANVTVGDIAGTFRTTTMAMDLAPDSFTFGTLTDLDLNQMVVSNAVQITGINTTANVAADLGEVVVATSNVAPNTGWASSATITNGQYLFARMNTSPLFGTTLAATVTVGDGSGRFTLTTKDMDTAPDPFAIGAFGALVGLEPNAVAVSHAVRVTGINTPIPVSTSRGEVAVANTTTVPVSGWAANATVANGSYVFARLTASPSFNTAVVANIAVGNATGTFSATTRLADTLPDAFDFGTLLDLDLDQRVVSNAVRITGIEIPVSVTTSRGEVAVANTTTIPLSGWAADATVANGSYLFARMNSSPLFDTTVTATVTVGDGSGRFTATTQAMDEVPDPFAIGAFGALTGLEPNAVAVSNAVRVTGINAPLPVSTSRGEVAVANTTTVPISGWAANATVRNNGYVFARLTTSPSFNTAVVANVAVGNAVSTFSATTRLIDLTPDLFDLGDLTGLNPNTVAVSNAVRITGIDLPMPVTTTRGEVAVANTTTIPASGWAANATVAAGEYLFARMNASASFATTLSATVTVGSVSGTFSVTTRDISTTPDPVTFTLNAFGTLTDQDLSTLVVSNAVRITGIEIPVSVTTTRGEVAVANTTTIPVSGWAANATVLSGQYVFARMNTSANFATTLLANVTVGSATGTFRATTKAMDITPDVFDFGTLTDLDLNQLVVSNAVRITGIDATANVTTSLGEVAVANTITVPNTGWTARTTISNGAYLFARMNSSPSFATTLSATITVGTGTGTFTATTKAMDDTPDWFTLGAFGTFTGLEPNTAAVSNAVHITGINAPAAVTTDLGEVAVANTAAIPDTGWTANATVLSGQYVFARMTTSANFDTELVANVAVGTGIGQFTTRTKVLDVTPDPIAADAFGDLTDLDLDAVVVSNPVRITGINEPIAVTTTRGEVAVSGTRAAPSTGWAANATVVSGQYVFARLTTSPNFATTLAATITVGNAVSTFRATTKVMDIVPDAFTFTALDGLDLAALVVSPPVRITGINTPVPVSTSRGEVAVSNTTTPPASGWATTATANNGDYLFVRVTTSPSFSTTVLTNVAVGDILGTFSATTKAMDTTPDLFAFATFSKLMPNELTVSAPVRITGINVPVSVTTTRGEVAVSDTNEVEPTTGWAATATIRDGQYLFARMTASPNFLANVSTIVTVSTVAASWTITTRDGVLDWMTWNGTSRATVALPLASEMALHVADGLLTADNAAWMTWNGASNATAALALPTTLQVTVADTVVTAVNEDWMTWNDQQ